MTAQKIKFQLKTSKTKLKVGQQFEIVFVFTNQSAEKLYLPSPHLFLGSHIFLIASDSKRNMWRNFIKYKEDL